MPTQPQSIARFGVAGNPPAFFKSSYRRDRINAPAWLSEIGLDAIEIQCTRGVRMSLERATSYREMAEQHGIELSIHGPYYISLGNPDPAVGENSLNELSKCVVLARQLGTRRIVFHPGSAGDNREAALDRAIHLLKQFEAENDLSDIWLCPEITGKRRQLGSLEDIVAIASEINSARPCLDLAHHHARTGGSLITQADIASVLDVLENSLGFDALQECHFHYYPIEWGENGEIRHRAFNDRLCLSDEKETLWSDQRLCMDMYYPRPEPFIEEIVRRGLNPLVICEAKDTQDTGAILMKELYNSQTKQRMDGV